MQQSRLELTITRKYAPAPASDIAPFTSLHSVDQTAARILPLTDPKTLPTTEVADPHFTSSRAPVANRRADGRPTGAHLPDRGTV
jgi:hypothetical protein